MKTVNHNGYELTAHFAKYQNGQTAIKLTDNADGFPYATATIAIDYILESDVVAIKDYSENEGICYSLIEAGIIKPPHEYIQNEFVKIFICKLITNE